MTVRHPSKKAQWVFINKIPKSGKYETPDDLGLRCCIRSHVMFERNENV
jgi:hypothetical protein